eukprot:190301_1
MFTIFLSTEYIANKDPNANRWIDPIDGVTDLNTRIHNVQKYNCFTDLPNILIFRLKRWTAVMVGNNLRKRKSNKKISYPSRLNMNKYIYKSDGIEKCKNRFYSHYPDTGPYVYDLRFIIIHSGSLNRGHYKCMTIDSDKKCYVFSDADYKTFTLSRYKSYFGGKNENAYMLGYVRQNKHDEYLITPHNANEFVPCLFGANNNIQDISDFNNDIAVLDNDSRKRRKNNDGNDCKSKRRRHDNS